MDIKSIRSTASSNRRVIFTTLLDLPYDEKFLGYLVTKKAKELGLVDENRKNLKGNTLVKWTEAMGLDGPNTPNAWACTAAVHLILDHELEATLTEDEVDTFAFYLVQDFDNEKTFFDAKMRITDSLTSLN